MFFCVSQNENQFLARWFWIHWLSPWPAFVGVCGIVLGLSLDQHARLPMRGPTGNQCNAMSKGLTKTPKKQLWFCALQFVAIACDRRMETDKTIGQADGTPFLNLLDLSEDPASASDLNTLLCHVNVEKKWAPLNSFAHRHIMTSTRSDTVMPNLSLLAKDGPTCVEVPSRPESKFAFIWALPALPAFPASNPNILLGTWRKAGTVSWPICRRWRYLVALGGPGRPWRGAGFWMVPGFDRRFDAGTCSWSWAVPTSFCCSKVLAEFYLGFWNVLNRNG